MKGAKFALVAVQQKRDVVGVEAVRAMGDQRAERAVAYQVVQDLDAGLFEVGRYIHWIAERSISESDYRPKHPPFKSLALNPKSKYQ